MKTITRLLFITFYFLTFSLNAQITQTIRGTIIDRAAETPLIGAAILIDKIMPQLEAITDENGNFEIKYVPTGRHQIIVSFIGYNAQTLPNIVVHAARRLLYSIQNIKVQTVLTATQLSILTILPMFCLGKSLNLAKTNKIHSHWILK